MNPYQDRQYIPPSPEQLPASFGPMVEKIIHLRERWAAVTEAANAARERVRNAPEEYRAAVVKAASEGKDIDKVPDVRIEAARDLEVRELAENGLFREVVAGWQELWNAVAADHATVLSHVDKPCEELTQKVADLERQLVQAKAELGVALGARRWVVSRTTPCDWDWARLHANRPQPMDGADASTLARLRREVRRQGLEPRTRWLRASCSAN